MIRCYEILKTHYLLAFDHCTGISNVSAILETLQVVLDVKKTLINCLRRIITIFKAKLFSKSSHLPKRALSNFGWKFRVMLRRYDAPTKDRPIKLSNYQSVYCGYHDPN